MDIIDEAKTTALIGVASAVAAGVLFFVVGFVAMIGAARNGQESMRTAEIPQYFIPGLEAIVLFVGFLLVVGVAVRGLIKIKSKLESRRKAWEN